MGARRAFWLLGASRRAVPSDVRRWRASARPPGSRGQLSESDPWCELPARGPERLERRAAPVHCHVSSGRTDGGTQDSDGPGLGWPPPLSAGTFSLPAPQVPCLARGLAGKKPPRWGCWERSPFIERCRVTRTAWPLGPPGLLRSRAASRRTSSCTPALLGSPASARYHTGSAGRTDGRQQDSAGPRLGWPPGGRCWRVACARPGAARSAAQDSDSEAGREWLLRAARPGRPGVRYPSRLSRDGAAVDP